MTRAQEDDPNLKFWEGVVNTQVIYTGNNPPFSHAEVAHGQVGPPLHGDLHTVM